MTGAGPTPATYGLGPDWVPGPDGLPFRRATRVILLDEDDRVLLVRGHDSGEPTRSWWFTVGGGLEAGESSRDGAAREVLEETGLVVAPDALVGPVLTRSAVFDFARVTCRQDESFFVARVRGAQDFSADGWTELERDVLDEMRWWPLGELEAAVAGGAVVYPATLPTLVRDLLGGWDGSTPHLDESSVPGGALTVPGTAPEPATATATARTSGPLVGVLALQGDVREHLAALTVAGARAVPVRRLAELAAVDGLVLPGGESTTIEKLLRAFGLFEPLRERVRAGLPVYGSCAGMILLADRVEGATADQRFIGGIDMTVRRNAFGRQVDSFETSLEGTALTGVDEPPLHAVFIRAPWVESVGPDVQVLARTPSDEDTSDEGKIVAVRHGRLLATAFHPEIGGETRVHRLFVEMVRDAAGRGSEPSS